MADGAAATFGGPLVQVMAGGAQGGAEAFFERLASALAEDGLEQRLLVRDVGNRAARLREQALQVTSLPFAGSIDLWSPWRVRRLLRRLQAPVVLSWMNRGAASVPRGPWVHAARLGGFYKLRYYRTADWLIGNTPAIVDYLVGAGWPRNRVVHLPNFVDVVEAGPSRAALDLPAGAIVLAYGRLHRNKGFDTLLSAFANVPDAILLLAGDGPERPALERYAAGQGLAERVRFLGWIARPQALLALANVFVCPSRHEPLGNVILEAMAAGRPIVTTASAGAGHLLEDGISAVITPIDDADALSSAIRAILSDPARADELGAAAKRAAKPNARPAEERAYRDFLTGIVG